MRLIKILEDYVCDRPKTKKVIGILLIVVGLIALLIPLVPGSWLAFVGLEFLGIRALIVRKFGFCNRLK